MLEGLELKFLFLASFLSKPTKLQGKHYSVRLGRPRVIFRLIFLLCAWYLPQPSREFAEASLMTITSLAATSSSRVRLSSYLLWTQLVSLMLFTKNLRPLLAPYAFLNLMVTFFPINQVWIIIIDQIKELIDGLAILTRACIRHRSSANRINASPQHREKEKIGLRRPSYKRLSHKEKLVALYSALS